MIYVGQWIPVFATGCLLSFGPMDGCHPHGPPDVSARTDGSVGEADGSGNGSESLCEAQSARSGRVLRAALETADRACTSDIDCVAVPLGTACYAGCSAVVSRSAAGAVQALADSHEETVCAGFASRGCNVVVPPCVPPGLPGCVAGQCDQVGYAVVLTTPDSGQTLEAHVGQVIELTLQNIGPGRYGTPALSPPGVVRLVEEVEVTDPAWQHPGGPRQAYRFEVQQPGVADLQIPVDDGLGRPSFTLTIEVK